MWRAAVVLVAAVALSGCGDEGTGRDATPPTVATKTTAAPAFGDFADLEAGRRYVSARFKPAIAFRVPPGAWSTEVGDSVGHVAIAATDPPGRIDQAILALHRMTRVFDPRRGGRIPGDQVAFSGSFARWLSEHPRLRTTQPKPVRLMGLDGVQLDLVNTRSSPAATPDDCGKVGPRCVPLFHDGLDFVAYSAGNHGRFTVLALPEGGELVIEQFVEPAGAFAAGLRMLRPLLGALELERPG